MSEEKTKGEGWLDIPGHLGWFVRYEHTDTWLDFRAYEVIAEGLSPNPGVKFFERAGSGSGMDHVEEVDEAEVAIEGYVKWDGCCEITIGQPHFCGAQDVSEFGAVMRKLHELCLLLPSVDEDCAGYLSGEKASIRPNAPCSDTPKAER